MRSDIPRHILMEEFSKAMAYEGIIVNADDVPRLMDIYMRIVIESSESSDITIRPSFGLDIVVDGTQHADFREMNDTDIENPKNYIRDAFESVNRSFGVRCDAEEAFSIFFWNADKGKANIIFAVDMEHASVEDACSYIKQYMDIYFQIRIHDIHQ